MISPMKTIPVRMRGIKASVPAYVDDKDFDKVKGFNWYIDHGSKTTYARSVKSEKVNGEWVSKSFSMHRMILKPRKNQEVDHINGKGLDNRRANLRCCSHKENLRNQKLHTNNTSGFKNVSWHSQARKWSAQISVDGRKKHLGLFEDVIEAAKEADRAAKRYFGEFAKLNFPLG